MAALHHTLPVTAIRREAHQHVLVRLDARRTPFPTEQKAEGQYVFAARPDEEKGKPFAVASRAGADEVELLVRVHDDEAERAALAADGEWRVSSPQGRGFPVADVRGADVLVVAMGGAVAAVRPALEAVVEDRARYGTVQLLYGTHSEQTVCFRERMTAWEAAEVSITTVLSAAPDDWQGARGRVQSHLPAVIPAGAAAFVCGAKAMEDEVAEALAERGLATERVFFNYR
jgi:NAD(P)H-flavin reductase